MHAVVIRGATVDGTLQDVWLADGTITSVCPTLDREPSAADVETVEANGGALIPGLHDHHIHLLAAAAAETSVVLGPPVVRNRDQLAAALKAAAESVADDGWIRGVGYHESVAGELNRAMLDDALTDRCVRVQHRSGALWALNSRAAQALHVGDTNGQLYRSDEWLRTRLIDRCPPSLVGVSAALARFGVTSVTDATPSTELTSIQLLADAVRQGTFVQSVVVMGGAELASAPTIDGVHWGPMKHIIADHKAPAFDAVCAAITVAHANGRPIAIHCVTEVAIAVSIAAWNEVGSIPGDRIEHGSIITPQAAACIAELGVAVVTQPGFIATRGDQYLSEVDEDDLEFLYPCASLVRCGVLVGGSTDAPFGDLDPWRAIAAAIDRTTETGAVLGANECVSARRALDLFLTPPDDPGGAPRRVEPGVRADLCLLDTPLEVVLERPSSQHVVTTIIEGQVVHRR